MHFFICYGTTPYSNADTDTYLPFFYSCASSKHLQTRRFLDTLEGFLRDAQRVIVHLHRAANAPPAPFVDHTGTLRNARTGRPIYGHWHGRGRRLDEEGDADEEEEGEGIDDAISEWSFAVCVKQ